MYEILVWKSDKKETFVLLVIEGTVVVFWIHNDEEARAVVALLKDLKNYHLYSKFI
jgi:hypothetical protein